MKTKSRQKVSYLTVKFLLGLSTLIVGLIFAGVVMFQTIESVDASLSAINRYVLGVSSFIAVISGTMLLNDAWVLRGILKGKFALPTYDSIVKAYQALYSVYLSKSEKVDHTEEEEETQS